MADSPVQLRDSVRKIRKRVVSVIRRGSSSKNVKSRTPSEDDKHDRHDDSEQEQELEHSPSHTNSATSSTHSLNKSTGSPSRPSSPSPTGALTPPAGSSRRLSLAGLSFPRSPSSKKNKSKTDPAPASLPPRDRTFSTPSSASPVEANGRLTLPIPPRPRTLSHPLAGSPILPGSPENEKDKHNVLKKPHHERSPSSPGTGAFGALASSASTLAAMAALHADAPKSTVITTPAVVLTPPAEAPAATEITPVPSPAPVPDVIAAPAPDLFTAATPKAEEPRDQDLPASVTERGHAREGSESAVKRTASTIGSDMGWSMLEPTQEEDEPEDEHANKAKVALKIEERAEPNKADDVPKADVISVQTGTEESGVKIEKDDEAIRNALADALPAPVDDRKPLPTSEAETEGEGLLNGALVMSPEGSEGGTPAQQAVPEPSDLAVSGIFIDTPPRQSHPTWISSVPTPPRATSPGPRPVTPPAQVFNPEQDGGLFSTPDNQRALRASTSPGSSYLSDTPSRFSGIETPPRPFPSGGDEVPPASMSDSFFHPSNVERLNPRHFERSMSTMGVFGDADPEAAGVQEKLRRATAGPRPSIDTSIHEMISPSVRGQDNELRGLAGTELKDWYEGETRTPKTVRMMLPETEAAASKPRSALAQTHTLEPPAEIEEAESKPEDKDKENAQLQPRPHSQRQPDRAQVYGSVLSRLMSHMDRRSSLMARLATRLGTLGGVGGPLPPIDRHPREWVAQVLPSGKVYYAHRLVKDELDDIDDRSDTQSITRTDAGSKVLTIPTPSAPQPVTLVTDLDMSDPATHSGVNSFVDKSLQERDVDLPTGWEIWIHVSGTGEILLDGSKAERWDEVSEAGTEPVDLGYGAPCVLAWTYVSHKRRRVGPQGPEDKFVVGEDAELDLEQERRYWAYLETHPAHSDVNPRAVQEAIELLTWHYTDRLLAEKKRGEKEYIRVNPPFTPEESHEVLEFIKSVSTDHSLSNSVLKTRTVARVHVRTAEWRLAKLHAVADAVNLEVMSPSERLRRRRAAANPFVGVPLRTLASLLGLGIPYLYVDQPDEKVEDRQRLMVADASTNLMSALMLGASVSFLAIPDLEDIARLAGVAAAACSLGSLAAGIVRLRLPSFTGGKAGEGTEFEQEPRPSALRTFARSLPLVLSAYAGSALVAGLAAYSWRGQVSSSLDDPLAGLYTDNSWSQNSLGGSWFGSVVRRDSGSGHGVGGGGPASTRPNWAESSQGLIRLWGTW